MNGKGIHGVDTMDDEDGGVGSLRVECFIVGLGM